MTIFRKPILYVLTAAAMALAGCASGSEGTETGGDAPQSDLTGFAKIEDLAKQEGELTFYTATHDDINKPEIEAFQKAYPEIEVVQTSMISGDLTARFASEKEAGGRTADIVKIADNLMLEDQPEWFMEIDSSSIPELENVKPDFVTPHYFANMVGAFVLTLNTDMMAQAPTTWRDLVDPRFAGKGELADPRAAASFMAAYARMRDLYGDEFLEQIGDADYKFWSSSSSVIQTLGAGGTSFAGPNMPSHSKDARAAGAPLEPVSMSPTMGLAHFVAINAEAEHPNAALVYANWLLTAEGQEASCQGLYQSVSVDGIEDCPLVADDFFIVDYAAGLAQADEINQLLGVQ